MNCASNKSCAPRGAASGYTLLEVLVALTVMMMFIGGVYMTFIQISKSHQEMEARMDAVRNGRAALATMSAEIKSALASGSAVYFKGADLTLPYGDGIDNDGDGLIDEEIVNGVLDENTSGTAEQLDRHAQIDTLHERPLFVGRTDLGDQGVDVDAKFGQDMLTFNVPPSSQTPDIVEKRITYFVESEYDGQPNVLMRRVEMIPMTGEGQVAETPLAFGVMGLDLLYWNPNEQPENQGWLTEWDSEHSASFPLPRLPLPASVYVRLTMYADVQAIETYTRGKPILAVPLETVVNIEEIINSVQYLRPTL